MANIPIIGKTTIGGAAKNISGGYVNIGGVWKPIIKTYVNIGGVWMSAWKNLTTWKKYNVNTTTSYKTVKSAKKNGDFKRTQVVRCASSYSFNANTGVYTLSNSAKTEADELTSSAKFFMLDDVSSGTVMYEYISGQNTSLIYHNTNYYEWTSTLSTIQSQGGYISDVSSEDESAYPDNGVHTDGYWYVKQ